MAHHELIAAAGQYTERGWPVFVLGRSKRPVANCPACRAADASHDPQACECLTCHGFYAATLDVDRVKAMFTRVPYGLLAIRTGTASGLVVVDIDPYNGGALDPTIMTPTRAVRSGSDGWHLYYQHPGAPLQSRPLPGREGVDIKADGGYVVAPPSLHPDTKRPYRLVVDRDVEEIPAALRAALQRPAVSNLTHAGASARTTRHGKPNAYRGHTAPPFGAGGITHPDKLLTAHLDAVAHAVQGSRRKTLFGAARGVARMVNAGAITHTEGKAALVDAGRRAEQTDRDIRAAITGGFRAEGLNP